MILVFATLLACGLGAKNGRSETDTGSRAETDDMDTGTSRETCDSAMHDWTWDSGGWDTAGPPWATKAGSKTEISQVTVGVAQSCSLDAAGAVSCWGHAYPTPEGPFEIVEVGSDACALDGVGALTCWGRDVDYVVQEMPALTDQAGLSVGWANACTLDRAGTATCWGSPYFGLNEPPDVAFRAISVGGWHACGITEDGTVLCWGDDEHGETSPPTRPAVLVASGEGASCAIDEAGAVFCWGDAPATCTPDHAFSDVAVLDSAVCGVTVEGGLVCWDDDGFLPVSEGDDFVAIDALSAFACALDVDGRVTCFGYDVGGAVDVP